MLKKSNQTQNIPNKISTIKWDVGAHISFTKNIFITIKNSIEVGMTTTQFFFGNPRSFTRRREEKENMEKVLELCERFPTNIFSHFPYISNLCGSVETLAWKGNLEQDTKTLKVLLELEYELGVIRRFKEKNGVIIHPGNYPDRQVGISTIAKSINKIEFPEGSTLILENAAGKGNSLATTFEEIKAIYDQILPEKQKNIGVCVDTAHICGYGLYDLSKVKEVERMFLDFDRIIGLDKFCLLHLNDSKVPLGSRDDRHAEIGTGYIWGESFESLIVLLDKCKEFGIPVVLETYISDMYTLAQLSDSTFLT